MDSAAVGCVMDKIADFIYKDWYINFAFSVVFEIHKKNS